MRSLEYVLDESGCVSVLVCDVIDLSMFDCVWTDPGVSPRESVGSLITHCLIDSFQNKMFSAIQDGEWLEDDQIDDGWNQEHVEAI